MNHIPLSAKIYVAGHKGLVGSAIWHQLQQLGYNNLFGLSSSECDLTDQFEVQSLFERERPQYVFLAAAKVGGIHANATYPADFVYRNLMIQCNIINAAAQHGVDRLLFLGSSCIYPRDCPQPQKEEYLLSGPLEFSNRPYAIAKIAGIETCWSYNRQHGTRFLAAMPTNLYGPGDNYHSENSHVIPALIRKMHLAKESNADEVILWGTGTAQREFLYSADLAAAAVHLMNLPREQYDPLIDPTLATPPLINIGVGKEITIAALAQLIANIVGFNGHIAWDSSKPDGTPRKVLDVTRINNLGWIAKTTLEEGLRTTYSSVQELLNLDLAAVH
ncbi:MAG: GDP-L-fucose synthase [Chlamydiales bacterium]|nr:GDP-L-fucose synthase [Chlamydiales bacterium]